MVIGKRLKSKEPCIQHFQGQWIRSIACFAGYLTSKKNEWLEILVEKQLKLNPNDLSLIEARI